MPYFHFSIGPVQEFVSQARRTNDFWGGSFLLSWLAGVAMAYARQAGAKEHYPLPPDHYLDLLRGDTTTGLDPNLAKVGAIPNRFCMKVEADFDPQAVETQVRAAWVALARHTREGLFGARPLGDGAETVWQRQIEHQPDGLWEIQWAVVPGDDGDKPAAFDARKRWRSHARAHEGAPFCALMAGWQALPLTEEEQTCVRPNDTDLGKAAAKNEQLCAPALVKRHFARFFQDFHAPELRLKGWRLPANAPSTHLLAAAPWLAQLIEKAPWDLLAEHESLALKCRVGTDEIDTRLKLIETAWQHHPRPENQVRQIDAQGRPFDFTSLHAPSWYDNEVQTLLADDTRPPEWTPHLTSLLTNLRALYRKAGASPAKHYVLLLMDGDHMGKMLKQQPQAVARALKTFTSAVPGIIEQFSGFLVYAGGDDVLAMLPPRGALECAYCLRQRYLAACRAVGDLALKDASISCALVYAHTKTPLTHLLGAAHALLDNVAKTQSGRDAIALQVWKRAGLNLTFAQKWQALFDQANPGQSLPEWVRAMADEAKQVHNARAFSNGFFQRAGSVLEQMAPLYQGADEASLEQLDHACVRLLCEAYRHGLPPIKVPVNGGFDKTTIGTAREAAIDEREARIKGQMSQLLAMAKAPSGRGAVAPSPAQADILPLLQFLVETVDGVEGIPT